MSGTKLIFSAEDIQKVKGWSADYPAKPTKKEKNASRSDEYSGHERKSSKRDKRQNVNHGIVDAKPSHDIDYEKLAMPAEKYEARRDLLANMKTEPPKEREKRPPAPIKWRTRNISKGTHAGGTLMWAYKRNYKVELIDSVHGVFPYTVTEITDPNLPKTVLKVELGGFKDLDGAKARCETIIRILGRGHDLALTENERENGEYFKSNCKFVKYETIDIPTQHATPESSRISQAERERALKLKIAKMSG